MTTGENTMDNVEEGLLLKTLLDIMDTSEGICFAKDLDGVYMYVNDAFSRLVGIPVEDIIGKTDFDMFPDATARMFRENDQRVIQANKSESVEEIGELDGIRISYRTNKTPLRYETGEVYGTCGIALDITNEKKLESELNELIAKLESANNTKDKLFSIIAHDLRAPFNALIPLTEMLYNEETIFGQDKLALYHELHKASSNTYDLLENLLAWANEQLDEVPVRKEKLDLKKVIEKAIMHLEQLAKNKELTIVKSLEDGIFINSDEKSLQIVFSNLISNAIKFTPRGGWIAVSSEVIDGICRISVTDNGVGISQKKIQKILDQNSFYSNNGTEGEPGTGIGLGICSDLVSRNGGQLNVESEEGKGSQFTVTIRQTSGAATHRF